MSCFLCSDKQIATVALAYVAKHPEADHQEVADLLLRANVASVRYRYGAKATECSNLGGVDLTKATDLYEGADLAAVVTCYDYQSCEHPAYEDSEARAIVAELLADLPPYDTSHLWSI